MRTCIQKIPSFNELHETYAGKGARVLAITTQSGSLEDIRPKVKEFGMKYTVLVANEPVVEGFGGVIAFPTTDVLDKDWKVYKMYLGRSGYSTSDGQMEKTS